LVPYLVKLEEQKRDGHSSLTNGDSPHYVLDG